MNKEVKEHRIAERYVVSNIGMIVVAVFSMALLGFLWWAKFSAGKNAEDGLEIGLLIFNIIVTAFLVGTFIYAIIHYNKARKNKTLISLNEDETIMTIHKLDKKEINIPIESLVSVDIKSTNRRAQNAPVVRLTGLHKSGIILIKYKDETRQMRLLRIKEVADPEDVIRVIYALISKRNKTKKDSLLEYIMNPNAKK